MTAGSTRKVPGVRRAIVRRCVTVMLACVGVGALAACSGAPSGQESGEGADSGNPEPLVIFAAASLQGSFDQLAEDFEKKHPSYSVDPIVYDGSQALATQVIDGADADVLAFANEKSLVPVSEADAAEPARIFATNTLQIAVEPGNPKGITDLDDLADPDLDVVLCAENVPCGTASHDLLNDADVDVEPVSEETNVTSVVTRVRNGEADAGLVYATDVKAADGDLDGITPANADTAVNSYPIAITDNAASPTEAQAFVDFVLSDAGQKVLHAYGFGAP